MKAGGIIAIGAIACAVGALMPGARHDSGMAAKPAEDAVITRGYTTSSAKYSESAYANNASSADYLSGEIVLKRQEDGHFYASPSVNSVPIHALVDTGASVVALTGSDAEAIGLNWDPGAVRAVGRGANGTVMGVRVRLDRVELGNFDVHDVDAIIIPEGLDVTLLGQSFLSRIPNVEIVDGEMNLSDR